MKHILVLPAVVLLGTSALPAQEPTAESILTRHLAARGGVARLKALETFRLKGVQVLMPAPMELPITIEQKRPNLQRVEQVVRGMTQITTFNGKEGWLKTPWAANKNAVPLRPEEIKSLAESDFDTPYLDWETKGWKLEYLGVVLLEDRDVYQVRIALSNTETILASFDTKTFQELRRERSYRELGNEVKLVSTFDDYKVVQGISFPFYILHRAEHRGHRLKLFIDSVDVNPKLADQRFEKP